MIAGGAPVGTAEAATMGLVDAVLEGPCPAAAIEWARARLGTEFVRVRDREDALAPAKADPALIDRAAAPLLKASGAEAPKSCVEAVRGAVTLPFDEGLRNERRLFEQLVKGDESRAQRHAFFAEREAQKARLPSKAPSRATVHQAAVIGAGTMGGGIAMCFANAGIPVTIIEMEQAAARPRHRPHQGPVCQQRQARQHHRGARPEATVAAASPARSASRTCIGEADIVVEAVFEEMGVKQQVFRTLDTLAKPGAILATNTSLPRYRPDRRPPRPAPATCSACTSSARPTS